MRADGFRRVTALLLLALIGITAATNTECALTTAHMAAAAQAPEHPHEAHPHQHDATPKPDPAGSTHDDRTHESDGCGLLMACGLAAPASHAPDVAFQAEHFHTGNASIRDAYDSPTLAFEPPPPRELLKLT